MDKAQSKFLNTAKKLDGALFELLEEIEFKDITVSKICKKAGVNRSTFYSHYDNTFELLQHAQSGFIASFFDKYELNASQIADLSPEDSNFITQKYIIPFLLFMKEHRKIYNVYMQNLDIFNSNELYEMMFKAVFIPVCNKFNMTDKRAIDYMARFYLMGITAIVRAWLKRDCIDDVYYICEIIMLCIRADQKGNFSF